MISKWLGVLTLLAVLVIGDQIRINRPGHKYRLTVEVETPDGIKSASGVMAVTPDRGYSRKGHTATSGDALFIDLGGGKNLVTLLAHLDPALDLDGMNYVALRAYGASSGQRASFSEMSRMRGVVPVTGDLIPVLATFADPNNAGTMRTVPPARSRSGLRSRRPPSRRHRRSRSERLLAGRFRRGARRARHEGHRSEVAVAEGGGRTAATALKAAGLKSSEPIDAREVFTRK